MSQIVDPHAAADWARGISVEAIIETGRHLPSDAITINPAEVDSETAQDEIERIDREFNEEYLRLRAETLEQELGHLVDVLDAPEVRELTPDEEKEVDRGWTTPASRRARDGKL